MNITLILISLLNFIFFLLVRFSIKNSNTGNQLVFFILSTVFFDLALLIYRFRYRNYILDFESFIGFYLIICYSFLFFSFCLNFILNQEQKAKIAFVNDEVKKWTRYYAFEIFDKSDRISYLQGRFYNIFTKMYYKFFFKTKLMAFLFVFVPWFLFFITILYETWLGQSFWYSLYFSAFRILLFRLRPLIYFIFERTIYTNLLLVISKYFVRND